MGDEDGRVPAKRKVIKLGLLPKFAAGLTAIAAVVAIVSDTLNIISWPWAGDQSTIPTPPVATAMISSSPPAASPVAPSIAPTPSVRPPAVTNTTAPQPTATVFVRTLDPTKWGTSPVSGVSVTIGEVIRFSHVGDLWRCAGPPSTAVGIEGDPQ